MKKLLFLAAIFIAASVNAQNNLEYFLKSAFDNNPQIKEYGQSLLSSKYERDLIDAENVLPKLSVSANYVFSPYFNNGGKLISANPSPDAIGYDIGLSNGGLYSALFNVDKNIFNGGVTDALMKQVSIKDETTSNNLLLLKHEIEKQVTDQYLQSLLSLKMIDLENEILGNLKEESAAVNRLKEKGLAKESDRLLLDIEVQNQTNALNSSRTQYRWNLNQLYAICGISGADSARIDSVALASAAFKPGSEYLKKYALDSLALLNQQEIFETKYNPQVSLFFNTGLMAVELTGIQRKFGLSAGINFSLPIYDGNQKSITRQQNEISLKTVSFYKDYFNSQLKTQRNNSFNRINSLKENISNLQSQIASYMRVIDISRKEYEKGLLSMLDYLTIMRNYIDLKKNLLTAQNDYQLEISNYNYWNW